MALTTKGLVDSIGATETRQYNDKTYISRTLIIEQPSYDPYTGEKRNSNFIKLEATRQETCDSLNNFPVGTKVEVEFIIRGSKYEKKIDGVKTGVFDTFNRIELRAIALASATLQAQAPAGASSITEISASDRVPVSSPASTSETGDTDNDEFPF